MSSQKATLEQIAREAGVSYMTVARVLSGKTKAIWPSVAKRAEHIRRAAIRLGYRPNSAAKAMAEGRLGALALVLSTTKTWSILPHGLLLGIESAMNDRDLHLVVATLPDEKLTSSGYVPKILRQLAADGLLINYNAAIPQRMIELIRSHSVPSVWINSKQESDAVYPDDFRAAVDATRRLLGLGHRRIVYLDYSNQTERPPDHYSGADRLAGYEQAMREAGLAPRRRGDLRTLDRGEMIPSLHGLLSEPDRPTAVLAYGQRESAGAFHAAGLLGLSVPRDLSIVRFGNRPYIDLGIRFTTVELPHEEVGRTSVEMLLTKIDAPGQVLPGRAIPFRFFKGATSGAA